MSDTHLLWPTKVICLDRPGSVADWVVIHQGRLAEVGTGDPPVDAERLDGVLLPGFIDAHVHLTTTGLYASGLDLGECRSVKEVLEALKAFLAKGSYGDDWLIAGNYDPGRSAEDRMPFTDELDRVTGDRRVLISRADGHSCALSSAGFLAVEVDPERPGIHLDEGGRPTGVLRNQANYEARRRVFASLTPAQTRAAQLAACDLALSEGITSVHEMAGGSYMGDKDFEVLLEAMGEYPIHVVPYVATLDVARVIHAGLKQIGGDLFLDGSIGSHTAAISEPYEDEDTTGSLYHSDDEIVAFFVEATRAGMQAGVHAIGDAAIEQALRCLEEATVEVGPQVGVGLSRLRHRIEHFECATLDHIERAASLGVVASVQPMFDDLWGGRRSMYAARLGERAWEMNAFSVMLRHSMVVAGGSDSTVTPLNPLLGISAAVNHHREEFRVAVDEALRMFTIWGAAAAHEEGERGSIEVGKAADFCLLERDPYEVSPDEIAEIEVLGTWVAGQRHHPER